MDRTLETLIFEDDSLYKRQCSDLFDASIEAYISETVETCAEYQRICVDGDEQPSLLTSGLFKRAVLTRGTDVDPVMFCRSSGTSGAVSRVPRCNKTLELFLGSLVSGFNEFWPVDDARTAFVLSPRNDTAEDIWISYVFGFIELMYETEYFVDDDMFRPSQLYEALDSNSQPAPILLGTPAMLLQFYEWLRGEKLRLALPGQRSYVITGGGWKDHYDNVMDKDKFAELTFAYLGVPRENWRDMFNMVELNTVFFECEYGVKHVPPWVRVFTLDPYTYRAIEPGKPGVLAFIDPTAVSYPAIYSSDDIGVVNSACCRCGRQGLTLDYVRRLTSIEERGCARQMARRTRVMV